MNPVEDLEVLPLESLRLDGNTQCRVEISEEHEADIQSLFNDDNPIWPRDLPNVKGCRDEAGAVWIWDGFYRLAAAKKAGCVNVPVRVRPGSVEDAQWLSCSANKEHRALRRTNADKISALKLALTLRPELPTLDLARHVGVHRDTVHEYRRKLLFQGVKSETDRVEDVGLRHLAPGESQNLPAWTNAEDSEESEAGGAGEEVPNTEDGAGSRGESEPLSASTEKGGADGGPNLAHPSQEAEDGPAASPPKDLLGVDLPTRAAVEAFKSLSLISDVLHHLHQLETAIDRLARHSGSETFRERRLRFRSHVYSNVKHEQWYMEEVDTIRKAVDYFTPYSGTCPACGDVPKSGCGVCEGLPYVLKSAWDAYHEQHYGKAAS